MSDVYSQQSANGDVVSLIRRVARPDGSQELAINDGAPNDAGTAKILLSREDARALGEALISGSDAGEIGGEVSDWVALALLRPEVVNRRIADAMTRGL